MTERSAALYAEADLVVTERLRAILGLRADAYDAEITALSEPANSAEADDTIVSPSASLAYRPAVDVLNVFDAEDADITYFYESRLPSEEEPASGIHLHPVEPRQLRVSLRRAF